MTTKVCSKCGEEKDIGDFYIGRARCKYCIKEDQKEYRENTRGKRTDYYKEYYETNKEKLIASMKEYYAQNKEDINKQQKEYRKENCDQIKSQQKQYQQTPSGKLSKSRIRQRRLSISKQSPCTLTLLQWEKILESQNNNCAICGKSFCKSRPPTKDHIVPLSQGGGLTFENVQALCKSCNSSKRAKLDHSKIITWSHHGIITRTT